MSKVVGLVFFLSLSLVDEPLAQNYGWEIGISGGPTLRNLHVTNRTLWPDGFDNEKEEESSLLGWDAGVTIGKIINKKWKVLSGVFFSKKGWESNSYRNYDIWSDEVIAETSILYHFEFVEVPLLLQYNFFENQKLKIFVKGGPSAGWLLSDYRTLNVHWGQPTEPQIEELYESFDSRNFYYRKFNIGVWLGLGISKTLGKRIEISAEPQFKAFVSDVNNLDEYEFFKTHPDRRKLYSFGLNLGIGYKFIKRKQKR